MAGQDFNAFEPYHRSADEPPGGAPGAGPAAGTGTGPDARPGSVVRAPAEQLPAHLTAGLLLLVMGSAVVAWVVRGLIDADETFAGFARAFVTTQFDAQISSLALTADEWALALALLTVATGLLLGRHLARGGALLLGVLLMLVALRQAVGALNEEYREVFSTPDYGGWMIATYAVAGVAGAVVVLLMLAARAPGPKVAFDPYGPRPRTARRTWAGALALALAAIGIAWIVDWQQQLVRALDGYTWGDYLRGLVDPAVSGAGRWGADDSFYAATFVLALVVAGALLIADRPAARGLTLTLLGVTGYLLLRDVVGIDYDNVDDYFAHTRSTLWLLSVLARVALTVAAVLLLTRPERVPADGPAMPRWYPGDSFPGDGGGSGGVGGRSGGAGGPDDAAGPFAPPGAA
jgi:hypothetical protein